jgi:phosphoenolpyruvate synthase/pyruvate phosphate dikinase
MKIKWEKIAERAYLPFSISPTSFVTGRRQLQKVGPFPVVDCFLIYRDVCYFAEGSRKAYTDYPIREYNKTGTRVLWEIARKCTKSGQYLLDSAESFAQLDYSGMDNKKLCGLADEMLSKFKDFTVFVLIINCLQTFLSKELQKIVDKRVADESQKLIVMQKLSETTKQNITQLEIISILRLASGIEKDDGLKGLFSQDVKDVLSGLDKHPGFLEKLQKHKMDFGWLQVRWLKGRPFSLEEIVARIKKLDNPSEKLAELEEKPGLVEKEFQELVDKFNLDDAERDFIRVLKEYVFLRTYRSDILNKTNFYTIPFLEEAARRLGIPYDDVLYLTYEEVFEGLSRGLADNIDIAARKQDWALFREGDRIVVYQGSAAVQKFLAGQDMPDKDVSDMTELKGESAFKGNVSGSAKIVLESEDISKVNPGDILVAVMTFPSFIAAMERASAFITDEGGILCHAAIIAREMKKPCIIATKVATKAIKDNDLLEVDADDGVVKIIKR